MNVVWIVTSAAHPTQVAVIDQREALPFRSSKNVPRLAGGLKKLLSRVVQVSVASVRRLFPNR